MQLVLDENFEKISKLQDERKNRIHAFNEILGGMVNGALILTQIIGLPFPTLHAIRFLEEEVK